jgi:cell wall-associated NlpC family hydrolase
MFTICHTLAAPRRENLLRSGLRILSAAFFVVSITAGCISVRVYNGDKREAIVSLARKMLDTTYSYGKQGRDSGFDCSGLTQYVYARAGINIPRTAKEQYRKSHRISRKRLENGDLVFFSTNGRGATHVGIYIGGRKFIHAPSSGRKVMISALDDQYWKEAFYGAGTYLL